MMNIKDENPPWSRRNKVLGYLLAISGLARASSYFFEPPSQQSLLQPIEQVMPFFAWAAVIFIFSVTFAWGYVTQKAKLVFVGHAGAFLIGVFLGVNLLLRVIAQQEAWSGVMPLVVLTLLHYDRVHFYGDLVRDSLGRKRGNK